MCTSVWVYQSLNLPGPLPHKSAAAISDAGTKPKDVSKLMVTGTKHQAKEVHTEAQGVIQS